MIQYEDIKRAEVIARDIGIPPQPDIVMSILQEMNKNTPDLKKISDLIMKDASTVARLLKVANSPFFSRAKVDSVFHAIQILGIKNFYNIVLMCSLEDIINNSGLQLSNLWKHSYLTAMIAGYIAKKYKLCSEEHAYMAGLFHDCGIMLMMKKWHDYNQIVEYTLYLNPQYPAYEKFELITAYETSKYTSNHCVLGYTMAKSWKLPDIVINCLLHHHHHDISIHKKVDDRIICSLLHISELISMSFDYSSEKFFYIYSRWLEVYKNSLSELGLSESSISPLITEVSRFFA
ncbi:HDOD domain-containing protein [hot springs metagenome]|uniref:HDOD domain-containing protein n=1 Tax=hot springs metagenome TaxID=433727 RepID=A0A5J4L8W6_9ZZZZ